jgi:hypothetical protein
VTQGSLPGQRLLWWRESAALVLNRFVAAADSASAVHPTDAILPTPPSSGLLQPLVLLISFLQTSWYQQFPSPNFPHLP